MNNQKNIHKLNAKNASSEEMAGLPIFYSNYVNTSEVAAILIDKMMQMCVLSPELAALTGIDYDTANFNLEDLSTEIDLAYAPEMINELMQSDFGQGLIFGLYLRGVWMEAAEQEEQEDE